MDSNWFIVIVLALILGYWAFVEFLHRNRPRQCCRREDETEWNSLDDQPDDYRTVLMFVPSDGSPEEYRLAMYWTANKQPSAIEPHWRWVTLDTPVEDRVLNNPDTCWAELPEMPSP